MLKSTFRLCAIGMLVLFLAACNSGGDTSTRPLLTKISTASSEECPSGGSTLTVGYDNTDDGTIDEVVDIATMCNGESGQNLLVEYSYDTSCESGGTSLDFGYDITGDGLIDTIVDTAVICSPNEVLNDIYGARVLYFIDGVSTPNLNFSDKFIDVLGNLELRGVIELTEVMSADFVASIGTGDFDVVIYSERNVGIPLANVTALTQWVNAGNPAILSTWSGNVAINQLFETSSVGVNLTSATFTDEVVGLFLNEVPVSDTGWVTYSRQLQPISSAYTACSWANNTSCAVVGNSGKTINLGIIVDSLSLYHTEILVPNLLRQVL